MLSELKVFFMRNSPEKAERLFAMSLEMFPESWKGLLMANAFLNRIEERKENLKVYEDWGEMSRDKDIPVNESGVRACTPTEVERMKFFMAMSPVGINERVKGG